MKKFVKSPFLHNYKELRMLKLTGVFQMYKSVFTIKNRSNSFNFSRLWSNKILWISYMLCLDMTGKVFSVEYLFSLFSIMLFIIMLKLNLQFIRMIHIIQASID